VKLGGSTAALTRGRRLTVRVPSGRATVTAGTPRGCPEGERGVTQDDLGTGDQRPRLVAGALSTDASSIGGSQISHADAVGSDNHLGVDARQQGVLDAHVRLRRPAQGVATDRHLHQPAGVRAMGHRQAHRGAWRDRPVPCPPGRARCERQRHPVDQRRPADENRGGDRLAACGEVVLAADVRQGVEQVGRCAALRCLDLDLADRGRGGPTVEHGEGHPKSHP